MMEQEQFQIKFENINILIQIIYLKDSAFIYIGDSDLSLGNCYLSVQTKFEQLPIVINLLDENCFQDQESINTIAKVLSKKLKITLFLTYNIEQIEQSPELNQLIFTSILKKMKETIETS